MSRRLTICLLVALVAPALALAGPGRSPMGGGPGGAGHAPAQQPTARPQPTPAPQPTTQQPPSPQPQAPRHQIGAQEPAGGPAPYTRPDRPGDRYSYPNPNRAYEYPRRDHGGYHPPPPPPHYGGWGWGPGWYDGGYYWPWNVVIEVPGRTVYVPVPTETAPSTTSGTPPATEAKVDPETLPLLGCDITAGDGKFLGTVDREYDSPESIANRESTFGSRTSELSIWNPAGKYGSPTSDYSPWNPQAKYPPMLTWHGAFKGYLTMNGEIKPAVSPEVLSKEIQAAPWR